MQGTRVHQTLRGVRRAGLALTVLAASALLGCNVLKPGGPGSCDDSSWKPTDDDLRRTVRQADGQSAPFYIVRFDRTGSACPSPATDEATHALTAGGITDIYVLCPGWGSSWYGALGWMDSFLAGYEQFRPFAETTPKNSKSYRPLYLGVIWPSDVMVDAFPAPITSARQRAIPADADRQALVEVLDSEIPAARLDRIKQELLDRAQAIRVNRLELLLARAATLTPPEQLELADCLLPLYGPQEEPSTPGPRFAVRGVRDPEPRVTFARRSGLIGRDPSPLPPIDAAELLEIWKRSVREAAADLPQAPELPGDDNSRARRRGLNMVELVRWALRSTDLRLMKDRAFRVGAGGFGELLAKVKATSPSAKIHLVGHSLGCEVLLSAVASNEKAGPVDSVLLMEPIVSAWTFAPGPIVGPDVSPTLQPLARDGVYRPVVTSRVARSVVVTYSSKDWVTSYFAPKALRRPALEGLASPDAWSGGNGFIQLGGTGPAGMDPPVQRSTLIVPKADQPLQRYAWDAAGGKLIAIDASESLFAHGEINDPSFWWLLANQVATPE